MEVSLEKAEKINVNGDIPAPGPQGSGISSQGMLSV
jgi:hypothetical protein